MNESHGQHIAGRGWAWRSGLALAWLALLAVLAVAAAAAVVVAYQASGSIR
jgi:hypothetical protein